MGDTVSLDAARTRSRGRPLTPHGHIDAAALHLVDARCRLVAVAAGLRDAAADLQDADLSLRRLRAGLDTRGAA